MTKQSRQRLFLLITLLAPLLLLAVVELGLRLARVGELEPLFVPVDAAPGFLQPNPRALQRFFPDPRQAPEVSIDTTWFAATKPPGTLRIFVQGESSAAGFPYGRFASPAALLQQRLRRTYPDREVEVINTGMAAVTSYVLLDFAEEILAQQPDAVVIYTGHNEYLGVGGVGSSLVSARSPFLARLVMQLRRLHLYRGLERALAPRLVPAPAAPRGEALMARVARERSIPLDSPLYRQGLAQFRGNLERLLRRYREAGVPVFIGTLAGNERDQPPFAGGDADADEDSANARYRRAQALEAAGDFAAARAEYVAASDRDELRFRAPSAFNALIADVAARYGATLVDVHAALAAASPHGIIGSGLMLEHVHPNVEGYFRLAAGFYPAIVAWAGPGTPIDDDTARRELPVTAIDRLNGEYRVAVLKKDWPFVPARQAFELPAATGPIERIAQSYFLKRLSWSDAMGEALAEYQRTGNVTEAARVAVNLADGFVSEARPQYVAGRLLLGAGQPERALGYLQRALALDAAPVEFSMSLAEALFKTGQKDASIRVLEGVLEKHPGEERATYWLRVLREGGQAQEGG